MFSRGFLGRNDDGDELVGFFEQRLDQGWLDQFGLDDQFQPVAGFVGFFFEDGELSHEVGG